MNTTTLGPSGIYGHLQLIPPFAEDFTVYGTPDTVKRASGWATRHRYLLAHAVPRCAHGMYLLPMCPGTCAGQRYLDHPSLWVPADRQQPPFLLAHNYPGGEEADRELELYARAHGLELTVNYPGDDWYGSGAVPVRLQVPSENAVWPIEREAGTLLDTQPVRWPDEGE